MSETSKGEKRKYPVVSVCHLFCSCSSSTLSKDRLRKLQRRQQSKARTCSWSTRKTASTVSVKILTQSLLVDSNYPWELPWVSQHYKLNRWFGINNRVLIITVLHIRWLSIKPLRRAVILVAVLNERGRSESIAKVNRCPILQMPHKRCLHEDHKEMISMKLCHTDVTQRWFVCLWGYPR